MANFTLELPAWRLVEDEVKLGPYVWVLGYDMRLIKYYPAASVIEILNRWPNIFNILRNEATRSVVQVTDTQEYSGDIKPSQIIQEKWNQQTRELYQPRPLTIDEIEDILSGLHINGASEEAGLAATESMKEFLRPQLAAVRLSPLGYLDYKGAIFESFTRSRIEPGTPIGTQTAESVGEPVTQMTLKTFHFAGVSSNVTFGIEQMKELLNMSKVISKPAMTIFFNPTRLIGSPGQQKRYRPQRPGLTSATPSLSFDQIIEQEKTYIDIRVDDLVTDQSSMGSYNEFTHYPWEAHVMQLRGLSIEYLQQQPLLLRLVLNTKLLYAYKITTHRVAQLLSAEKGSVIITIASPTHIGIVDVYPLDERLLAAASSEGESISAKTPRERAEGFIAVSFFPVLRNLVVQGITNAKSNVTKSPSTGKIGATSNVKESEPEPPYGIRKFYPIPIKVWSIVREEQISRHSEYQIVRPESPETIDAVAVIQEPFILELLGKLGLSVNLETRRIIDRRSISSPIDLLQNYLQKQGPPIIVKLLNPSQVSLLASYKLVIEGNKIVDQRSIGAPSLPDELITEFGPVIEEYNTKRVRIETLLVPILRSLQLVEKPEWKLLYNFQSIRLYGIHPDALVTLVEACGLEVIGEVRVGHTLGSATTRGIGAGKPIGMIVRTPEAGQPSTLVNKAITQAQNAILKEKEKSKQVYAPLSRLEILSRLMYAETLGSNMKAVLGQPEIDATRTYSNNVYEVYDSLGIEASRNFFIKMIHRILTYQGSNINFGWITVMGDFMTNLGEPLPITVKTATRQKVSAMQLAAFSSAIKHIRQAAVTGEEATVSSVTESIALSQKIGLGTGYISIGFSENEERRLRLEQLMTPSYQGYQFEPSNRTLIGSERAQNGIELQVEQQMAHIMQGSQPPKDYEITPLADPSQLPVATELMALLETPTSEPSVSIPETTVSAQAAPVAAIPFGVDPFGIRETGAFDINRLGSLFVKVLPTFARQEMERRGGSIPVPGINAGPLNPVSNLTPCPPDISRVSHNTISCPVVDTSGSAQIALPSAPVPLGLPSTSASTAAATTTVPPTTRSGLPVDPAILLRSIFASPSPKLAPLGRQTALVQRQVLPK